MIVKNLFMAEYGLLGRGLDHSFSSDFFKKKFKKEELPHRYRNFDLHTLKDIRDLIAEENFKGLNVTIPYKTEIMTFLDFIDPVAKKIGAVNTIKMTTEGLIGYNTDAFGFEKSLKFFPLFFKFYYKRKQEKVQVSSPIFSVLFRPRTILLEPPTSSPWRKAGDSG